MSELRQFLLARLAEDEITAKDTRALRLIMWRRKLTERHYAASDWSWSQFGCRHGAGHDGEHKLLCGHCKKCWPCPEIAEMGLVEADHPDYRPEWKPWS